MHTLRVEIRTTTGNWSETWSFKFTGAQGCGLPTPNGGTFAATGPTMLVWETAKNVGACTPPEVAADINRASGRDVAALWFLDGAAGEWRYYLKAGPSTLTSVPELAALIAVFT